jgi:hypothetical protein
VGVHPIAVKAGGGFCYIEGAHVHMFAPDHLKTHYRLHEGSYFFIGDPVAYGYDGPKNVYYGHHPVSVGTVVGAEFDGVEHCYLEGPHYHYWAPPVGASFEPKGGAYWYVGSYGPEYRSEIKVHGGINKVYDRITYAEPMVIVDPPAAYVGPIVGVHGGVHAGVGVHASAGVGVSAGVAVEAPVVEVRAPVIEVGLPFVVVDGHHHHHDVVVVDRHRHKHWKHKKHRKWKGHTRRHREGRRRHRW